MYSMYEVVRNGRAYWIVAGVIYFTRKAAIEALRGSR